MNQYINYQYYLIIIYNTFTIIINKIDKEINYINTVQTRHASCYGHVINLVTKLRFIRFLEVGIAVLLFEHLWSDKTIA